MAEIILSPFLQVIFDNLASPALQRLGDICGLKDNFLRLQELLPRIRAHVLDAEKQQTSNKAMSIWLSKLRDAVYDAEDLLDDLTLAGFSMSSGLQDAILEIRAVEGLNFHWTEVGRVDRPSNKRETTSFVINAEVYGREEDKEKIIPLLTCEATQGGDVSFILIIGMGGLGKTTLAQLVYNDERVTGHFDIKLWVFVSDDFDVKKIIKAVIQSATESMCDFLEMDVLQSKLWHLLHNKRYLLVLDDVWNEHQDEWDKLRPLFRGGVDGSKIIVTTRSKKVALSIDSPTFPYYLKVLPDDDCWTLFKQRAFRQGEEKEHPNLLAIGKRIVKKCGGVPLAAKTLGSLMRFKREEREWLFVQNSELWNLDVCESGILPALRLSYNHLPSHLKHCFEFCSIFPKSYEIKKKKVIHLWMAEGLIPSDKGSKQPEDIGNEYFNDLLWMSFFQEADNCNNSSMTGYKMHDIIHDLPRSVAEERSLILEHGLPTSSFAPVRRCSIICDFRASTIPEVPEVPEALYEAKHLRTLLLFPGPVDFIELPHKLISSFEYLRVLDLNGCGLTRFVDSIGGLMCLRYLDLSHARVQRLPLPISKLRFLQTLNLFNCFRLVELPDLAQMIALRHLNVTECESLTSMMTVEARIAGSVLLTGSSNKAFNQLQTLPVCIVGGRLDLELLGFMTNLRGELNILRLENVNSADDAVGAKLVEKDNLESLELYWRNNDQGNANKVGFLEGKQPRSSGSSQGHEPDASLGEEVIKRLRPPLKLKQLFVKGYPGIRFPHWTLPNLIVVDLSNFKNCRHLPVLGNLLLLKTLSLREMKAVKCIGKEFYGKGTERPFPSLQELVLGGFPNLEEWSSPNDKNAFPSLRKVIVSKCPNLTTMPLFQSLQHLELRDCNPRILKSTENLKYLSLLAIEKVPELSNISGGLLANNSLLTSLEIISCPRLRSLPPELGNLAALKSLTIRWCQELFCLPGLQNLKALESLEICDCHNIGSMPNDAIGGLSSLRTLSIESCSNLTSFSTRFQHLTSLEHLTIMYCPSLDSLPEGVQQLSALRSWTILSCPEFLCLPEGLQHVTTLQSLEIGICHGLTVLPEWMGRLASLRTMSISDCKNLKYLPEGLEALSGLQHLSIQDCPELEERCKQEIGEDWLKIAHIPYRRIGTPVHSQSSTAGSSSH